jgi:predicted dehydrogenase
MGERLSVPAYTDYQELLTKGPEFDIAIVCTPPNTHERIAIDCLQAGKNVLCEKPFTLTSESAKRMVDVARKANRLITMASKFRYVEDIIKAKSLLASNILGDVILFENAFTSKVDMSRRWNSLKEISGGGVLIDNGTHSVDIARYFLGPLNDVHSIEGKRVQGLEVEDTVRLFCHSRAGVLVSVDLSWSINKDQENYINIYGSLGTMQIGWKNSRYRLHSGQDWVKFGNGYNKVQAFRDIILNFSRAIHGVEPLRITHEDALASVRTIETAYMSLESTRWDRVSDSKF